MGTPGYEFPVTEYSHAGGKCSVTGGVVVRNSRLAPSLNGLYLFSDYCTGELFAIEADDVYNLPNGQTITPTVISAPDLGGRTTSFGKDQRTNDTYVVLFNQPIYLLRD